MLAEISPLRVLLLTVSDVVNRHQADVIAYLVEENRVLYWSREFRAVLRRS